MRKPGVGVVLAGLTAASLTFAAPAGAASPGEATAQAVNCVALESVTIRERATTRSTALGLFPKGAGATCGAAIEGGTYTACGHTDGFFWIEIDYRGVEGYVALYCVTRP
ncbi:hypothetical protein [Streptomyces sp. URMC 129]|uniref:hypothetical protein n=1 Tax=Streptomyces sp. URMC 129 TaxID=3423407 RepID=UPI003F1E3C80